MATIARVPRARGVAYQVRIKRRGRLVRTKTFRTRTAAREWARRIESDVEMELALEDPGRRTRFDELCHRYLEEYDGRDHHRVTQVRWWQARLENARLADIRLEEIRRHLNLYRDGLDRTPPSPRSAASTNRMKAALSALFAFGMKRGLALRNPARQIPAETEHNHRTRYLSEDERLRLLVACRASKWDRLYLLVLMALMTGARKGELLTIRWEQIDFSQRRVTLDRAKNGEPRVLSLPLPVIEELLRHRDAEGRVFPARRGNRRAAADPGGPWKAALVEAGIAHQRATRWCGPRWGTRDRKRYQPLFLIKGHVGRWSPPAEEARSLAYTFGLRSILRTPLSGRRASRRLPIMVNGAGQPCSAQHERQSPHGFGIQSAVPQE